MSEAQSPKGTVVITGGSGFVGLWLQKELAAHWPDANVVSWDLPDVDITKSETYQTQLAELKPQWIVHLAAIASVPAALKNPELVTQVNVEGTQALYETLLSQELDTKVLFTSTADVYGVSEHTTSGQPVPELPLAEAKPNNPYAQSKLEAETLIEKHWSDRTIRVRPFPHVGPGQGLGFVTADFASQIANIEIGEQDSVLRVGNLEARRDFTDVRDVVRAYRMLMETGACGEVYHIASGTGTSIQAILDMLLTLSPADITVQQDPERMRPSDIPVLIGDASKLKKLTNWKPEIPLEKSLQNILDWWRSKA